MVATVYIDVLFMVNFIINILLIEAGGVICGVESAWHRTLPAAALGALYAVCVFFPQLQIFYTVIMKIVFSAAMVAAAYRPRRLKMFFRLWVIFYAVSFVFGGAVIAIMSFTSLGYKTGAIYSNGVLYMNLPWQVLLLCCAVSYAFVTLAGRIRRKRVTEESVRRNVSVFLNGKSASFTAIVDTGNSLSDPITGDPVIVCEFEALKAIFPPGEKSVTERLAECGAKLRMIPFSSVGKESGVMPGFLPDEVKIDGMAAGRCVVCVCETSLSRDRAYGALINPRLTVNEGV